MSPVVLVVLIAWALLSVLFLTGTLLAARSIDRSVAVIKPNVIQIGDEGAFICSYECTFCEPCAAGMAHVCPNCGGALRPRPTRAT